MNTIITLILLILILSLIVFVHEFGHFIAAKKNKVYVHEFAIGMGPKIFSFKRKNDETEYSLRALPLGGFNAIASETEGRTKGIKKDQILENKKYSQRLVILIMGIVFNFVLAMILLFINASIYGSPVTKAYVGEVEHGSTAYHNGIKEDDLIVSVDGKKINSFDDLLLETRFGEIKEEYEFVIKREDKELTLKLNPEIKTDDEGNKYPVFGIAASKKRETGLVASVKYMFKETLNNSTSLFRILGKIFTGKIGLNNLSGPVGIYGVIDNVKSKGLENLIYLTAYLSINVGIINLLPIPVFDGGRVLLLLIERIKGKRINEKAEYVLNAIGTVLLILLMLYVTIKDIFRLF